MERFTVVGFMPVEFKNQRTGATIKGTSVHCLTPMSSSGYGQKVDKLFMNSCGNFQKIPFNLYF